MNTLCPSILAVFVVFIVVPHSSAQCDLRLSGFGADKFYSNGTELDNNYINCGASGGQPLHTNYCKADTGEGELLFKLSWGGGNIVSHKTGWWLEALTEDAYMPGMLQVQS